MNITKTSIQDVLLIQPDKHEDDRGFFARTFDSKQFYNEILEFNIVQTSIAYSKKKGTIRGMHYQIIPFPEQKIVQCIKGSIYDVVIDLRQNSKTYNRWDSFNLNDKNNLILYVPSNIAHGYQTLEDNTVILYYMDEEYHPEYAKEISYKSLDIKWNEEPTVISEKDKNAPTLKS